VRSVDLEGDLGEAADAVVGELEGDAFGCQQASYWRVRQASVA